MGNLDILHPIPYDKLNERYYFDSLTQQALSCGSLSETDMEHIQSDLLLLLAKQAEQYTNGKSSSIPNETAQKLLTSIVFIIGMQLKTFSSPENAVQALLHKPIGELFNNGMDILHRKMVTVRRLQRKITENLLDTPNVFYRSTVIDGINGFFKLYQPQFSAQEIHITADYPTYMGRPRLDGIEFIEQYLLCLQAENDFCVLFHSSDIHYLLCGLTQDYRSCPMNLFEPILLSTLGLVMLGRSPQRLDLTQEDVSQLQNLFIGKSKKEICSILESTLTRLEQNITLSPRSQKYIRRCLPRLTDTIRSAAEMKTLDKVFLIPVSPAQEQTVCFSYGDRMDDIKYRKLLQKILRTENSQQKISLILQDVHSLADISDILSDAELSEGELQLLVNMLPSAAFAALLFQYPNDDFLERESEQLLCHALQHRKASLSKDEENRLRQFMHALKNSTKEFD